MDGVNALRLLGIRQRTEDIHLLQSVSRTLPATSYPKKLRVTAVLTICISEDTRTCCIWIYIYLSGYRLMGKLLFGVWRSANHIWFGVSVTLFGFGSICRGFGV